MPLVSVAGVGWVRCRSAGQLAGDGLGLGFQLGLLLPLLVFVVGRGLVLGDGGEVEPVHRAVAVSKCTPNKYGGEGGEER